MTLCHFCLCLTSAWALNRIGTDKKLASNCFLFLFGHSIFGILFYQSRRIREDTAIEISTYAAETMPHPLINAQLYTSIGHSEIGYVHVITALIPTTLRLFNENIENEIINLFQTLNIISSIYLATKKDNGWCALMAINQLITSRTYHYFDEDKLDWIAGSLSLFTIMAVKSIETITTIK